MTNLEKTTENILKEISRPDKQIYTYQVTEEWNTNGVYDNDSKFNRIEDCGYDLAVKKAEARAKRDRCPVYISKIIARVTPSMEDVDVKIEEF